MSNVLKKLEEITISLKLNIYTESDLLEIIRLHHTKEINLTRKSYNYFYKVVLQLCYKNLDKYQKKLSKEEDKNSLHLLVFDPRTRLQTLSKIKVTQNNFQLFTDIFKECYKDSTNFYEIDGRNKFFEEVFIDLYNTEKKKEIKSIVKEIFIKLEDKNPLVEKIIETFQKAVNPKPNDSGFDEVDKMINDFCGKEEYSIELLVKNEYVDDSETEHFRFYCYGEGTFWDLLIFITILKDINFSISKVYFNTTESKNLITEEMYPKLLTEMFPNKEVKVIIDKSPEDDGVPDEKTVHEWIDQNFIEGDEIVESNLFPYIQNKIQAGLKYEEYIKSFFDEEISLSKENFFVRLKEKEKSSEYLFFNLLLKKNEKQWETRDFSARLSLRAYFYMYGYTHDKSLEKAKMFIRENEKTKALLEKFFDVESFILGCIALFQTHPNFDGKIFEEIETINNIYKISKTAPYIGNIKRFIINKNYATGYNIILNSILKNKKLFKENIDEILPQNYALNHDFSLSIMILMKYVQIEKSSEFCKAFNHLFYDSTGIAFIQEILTTINWVLKAIFKMEKIEKDAFIENSFLRDQLYLLVKQSENQLNKKNTEEYGAWLSLFLANLLLFLAYYTDLSQIKNLAEEDIKFNSLRKRKNNFITLSLVSFGHKVWNIKLKKCLEKFSEFFPPDNPGKYAGAYFFYFYYFSYFSPEVKDCFIKVFDENHYNLFDIPDEFFLPKFEKKDKEIIDQFNDWINKKNESGTFLFNYSSSKYKDMSSLFYFVLPDEEREFTEIHKANETEYVLKGIIGKNSGSVYICISFEGDTWFNIRESKYKYKLIQSLKEESFFDIPKDEYVYAYIKKKSINDKEIFVVDEEANDPLEEEFYFKFIQRMILDSPAVLVENREYFRRYFRNKKKLFKDIDFELYKNVDVLEKGTEIKKELDCIVELNEFNLKENDF